MSKKNYFFLLFTFYFGSFTKSKIKIKGKRQCDLLYAIKITQCANIHAIWHIQNMLSFFFHTTI